MIEYLEDQVERNVERDIRMLVLDSALDRLALEKKKDCLDNIAYQGLDQVILLESPASYDKGLEVAESRKLLLGITLEKIKVSVENFPFQPSVLENELKINLDGAYLVNGAVYEKRSFNEKYSVVLSEVDPEGARFSKTETQLTFESS